MSENKAENSQTSNFCLCVIVIEIWGTNKASFYDKSVIRLRRKENALNDWELQQTRKAMDKMDKIQACKLIPSKWYLNLYIEYKL